MADEDDEDLAAQIEATRNTLFSMISMTVLIFLLLLASENGGGLILGDIIELIDGDLVGMKGNLHNESTKFLRSYKTNVTVVVNNIKVFLLCSSKNSDIISSSSTSYNNQVMQLITL